MNFLGLTQSPWWLTLVIAIFAFSVYNYYRQVKRKKKLDALVQDTERIMKEKKTKIEQKIKELEGFVDEQVKKDRLK